MRALFSRNSRSVRRAAQCSYNLTPTFARANNRSRWSVQALAFAGKRTIS